MHRLNLQNEWLGLMLEVFCSSCSGAVVAGQEAGPEMGQSSCSHPEHLEEVEGEIWKEHILYLMFSYSFFMVLIVVVSSLHLISLQ